jgi:hypothetical protein
MDVEELRSSPTSRSTPQSPQAEDNEWHVTPEQTWQSEHSCLKEARKNARRLQLAKRTFPQDEPVPSAAYQWSSSKRTRAFDDRDEGDEWNLDCVIRRVVAWAIENKASLPKTRCKLREVLWSSVQTNNNNTSPNTHSTLCSFEVSADPLALLFHLQLNGLVEPVPCPDALQPQQKHYVLSRIIKPQDQLRLVAPDTVSFNVERFNDFKWALLQAHAWCVDTIRQNTSGISPSFNAEELISTLSNISRVTRVCNPDAVIEHLARRGVLSFSAPNQQNNGACNFSSGGLPSDSMDVTIEWHILEAIAVPTENGALGTYQKHWLANHSPFVVNTPSSY